MKFLMIFFSVFSDTVFLKSALLLSVLFLFLLLHINFRPYLTKQLNESEFRLLIVSVLVLELKVISHESNEKYKILFMILNLFLKISLSLVLAKNFIIWRIRSWKTIKSLKFLYIQEKMESKTFFILIFQHFHFHFFFFFKYRIRNQRISNKL